MKELGQPDNSDEPLNGTEIVRRTIKATIGVYVDLGILYEDEEISSIPLDELQSRVDRYKRGLAEEGKNPDNILAGLIAQKFEENI